MSVSDMLPHLKIAFYFLQVNKIITYCKYKVASWLSDTFINSEKSKQKKKLFCKKIRVSIFCLKSCKYGFIQLEKILWLRLYNCRLSKQDQEISEAGVASQRVSKELEKDVIPNIGVQRGGATTVLRPPSCGISVKNSTKKAVKS